MDDNKVPFAVLESVSDRFERSNKRLWFMCIMFVFLLLATNVCWIVYESQFEKYEETEIDAEQEGSCVNIIGGNDVYYGAEGKDYQEKGQEKEDRK